MDHFRAVMMSKCMAGLVCVCERGRVVHVLVERVRVLTVIIINIFFVRITHCWENHPIYQYIEEILPSKQSTHCRLWEESPSYNVNVRERDLHTRNLLG